jgi:DNA-binding HxlR family transcriptional regulator
VLGEKWSLLVVRELALGVHRFDQIQRNTGAPRDILTSRLRRLEDAGVIEKRPYQERPLRHEYRLTESGNELRPILLSLSQWGERWTKQVNVADWVHTCGEVVEVTHTCKACGGEVTGKDLRLRRRDAAESAA